jgi:hypothetical protein
MLNRIFLSLIVSSFGFCEVAQARTAPHSAQRRSVVPPLNVEAGCKEAAALYHNKTTNYPSCMADERTARAQLEKEWAKFSPDARTQCIYLVTEPAIPSYVTLQACLQMQRDAKNVTSLTEVPANPATP